MAEEVRTVLYVENLDVSIREVVIAAFKVEDFQTMDYNIWLLKSYPSERGMVKCKIKINYPDDKLSSHVYNMKGKVGMLVQPSNPRVPDLLPISNFASIHSVDELGKAFYNLYRTCNTDASYTIGQRQFVSKFIDIGDTRSDRHFKLADVRSKCCLQNLGNTCYMNSALQILMQCREMVEAMVNNYCRNIRYFDDKPVSRAFMALALDFWVVNKDITSPSLIWKTIGQIYPQFNDYTQQDSHEFIVILLNKMHEEMNRMKQRKELKNNETDSQFPIRCKARNGERKPNNDNLSKTLKFEEELVEKDINNRLNSDGSKLSKRDELKTSLKKAIEDYDRICSSPVSDLFRTVIRHAIVCDSCNTVSTTFEEVYSLILPIPEKRPKRPYIFISESGSFMGTIYIPEGGCTLSCLSNEIMGDLGIYTSQDIVGILITFNERFHEAILDGLDGNDNILNNNRFCSDIPTKVLFPTDILTDGVFEKSIISDTVILFLYPVQHKLDSNKYGVGIFAFEDFGEEIDEDMNDPQSDAHLINNSNSYYQDSNNTSGSIFRFSSNIPHTGLLRYPKRTLSLPFVATFPIHGFTTKRIKKCIRKNYFRFIKRRDEITDYHLQRNNENKIHRSTDFEIQECLSNIITEIDSHQSGIDFNDIEYYIEENITHTVRKARVISASDCSVFKRNSLEGDYSYLSGLENYTNEDMFGGRSYETISTNVIDQKNDNDSDDEDKGVLISKNTTKTNLDKDTRTGKNTWLVETSMRVFKFSNKINHTDSVTLLTIPSGYKLRSISEFFSSLREMKSGIRNHFRESLHLSRKKNGSSEKQSNPNVPCLSDCMLEYFKPTILSGQNKYNCSTCKKHTNARILQTIAVPSKYILVQLKRFKSSLSLSKTSTYFSKNSDMVDYPTDKWNINDFIDPDIVPLSENYTYNLVGICVHNGSLYNGHYTAFIRYNKNNNVKSENNNHSSEWLCFNDSSFYEITRPQVSGAYILLYKLESK